MCIKALPTTSMQYASSDDIDENGKQGNAESRTENARRGRVMWASIYAGQCAPRHTVQSRVRLQIDMYLLVEEEALAMPCSSS